MNSTNLTLELQPMDRPQTAAPTAANEIVITPLSTARAVPAASTDTTDQFLKEATHQYAEGHIDQPLWDRAFAQAKGDKEAAVALYLQARATALRLLDRGRKSERRAHAARAVRHELDETAELRPYDVEAALRFGHGRALAWRRYAAIAGAILVPLAIGGWLLNTYLNARHVDAARAVPVSGTPKAPVPAATATKAPAAPRVQTGASPELLQKIQELRDAGNSNVLVFYLAEWTRKEPANPAAWDQLRAGYETLKQYDDALGAARKALELAPEDPRMWRNLGVAQVDVGDPVAALRAFDQAVARNGQDAESFRRIGILNAQLSQIQDAGRAFDRALAINPDDPVVLCMRSAVAALSAMPRDTYATAKQARAIDAKCRGG